MKKAIIVFTYKYPFEPPTEQFLHDELKYILDADIDVYIVPTAKIINNTEKYYDNINKQKFRVVLMPRYSFLVEVFSSLRILLSHGFRKDFIKILTSKKQNKTYLIKETIHQYLQAGVRINGLKTIIKQINAKYSQVIMYSYWLGPMTLALAYNYDKIRKKYPNLMIVTRAHGDGDLYLKNGMQLYRPGLSKIENNIACIYSISEKGAEVLKNEGFTKVAVKRLGVPSLESQFTNETKCTDKFVIVSCSTINSNKRVWDIAKLIAKIEIANVEWHHFGNGELYNDILGWCEQHIKDKNRYNLHGFTMHSEIIEFYKKMAPDLFINLSKIEGIPVSIMEAFSCGIPCIATNVGATSEIVYDGMNGYLVNSDYTIDLLKSQIMNYYYLDAETKQELRNNAKKTWNERFNSDINYPDFINSIFKIAENIL